MWEYAQRKLEYTSSSNFMKFYSKFFLTLFIFITLISVTFKFTISGYNVMNFLLLDIVSLGLAVISFINMAMLDRWTFFINCIFLIYQMSYRIYSTYTQFIIPSVPIGFDAESAEKMADNSMQVVSGAITADPNAVANASFGFITNALSGVLKGMFKNGTDYSKFVDMILCETWVIILFIFLMIFISNYSFFSTPLNKLREAREELE